MESEEPSPRLRLARWEWIILLALIFGLVSVWIVGLSDEPKAEATALLRVSPDCLQGEEFEKLVHFLTGWCLPELMLREDSLSVRVRKVMGEDTRDAASKRLTVLVHDPIDSTVVISCVSSSPHLAVEELNALLDEVVATSQYHAAIQAAIVAEMDMAISEYESRLADLNSRLATTADVDEQQMLRKQITGGERMLGIAQNNRQRALSTHSFFEGIEIVEPANITHVSHS